MKPLKFETSDMLNTIETFPPNHPAHIAALKQMFNSLPQDGQNKFHAEAMTVLGNPEPDAYDKDGQPLFTAETMVRSSGIPIDDIESHAAEYEKLYGKVEVDEKVTVLKRPEVGYELTSHAALLLSLAEWSDGNERVVPMLEGWFKLAIERGCKPIAINQLKHLVRKPGWARKDVERYLNRLYKFVTPDEFFDWLHENQTHSIDEGAAAYRKA